MNQTTEISKAETAIAKAADIPIEQGKGLVVRNSGDLKAIAQVIAASGLCPQGYIDRNTKQPKLNDIKIAIVHGQEIGMSPMQALNSLSVINNRADLYAEGRPALIFGSGKTKSYRDGYKGKFPEDDFCAWVEVERADCDVKVYREFSVWDAKQADLWMSEKYGKPTNWKLYPKDQLMWKAMSRALRVAFADLLKGVGFVEDDRDLEIHGEPASAVEQEESRISFEVEQPETEQPAEEEIIDAETTPVDSDAELMKAREELMSGIGEPVDDGPDETWVAYIQGCGTVDELDQLWGAEVKQAKLSESEIAELKGVMESRRKELLKDAKELF